MYPTKLAAVIILVLASSSVAYATDGITYYHFDVLGSPVLATGSNGEALWRKHYQPFGQEETECYQGCLSAESRSFTGHEREVASGLVYMQARFYDPAMGRFLSIDPMAPDTAAPASINRYAYARNNPYRYVDPNGEDPYLVSRTVDGPLMFAFSHNFVVTNADYPGDPRGRVYSYGKTNSGRTGRVTSKTGGLSANTHATDRAYWRSLKSNKEQAQTYSVKVDAPDAWVDRYAIGVLATTPYSATTIGSETTNSNSAASAVINSATGKEIDPPDGMRVSPGAGDWQKIDFNLFLRESR